VKVQFQDCTSSGPFTEQWWPNSPDYNGAQAVALQPGETAAGVDAVLDAAAAITGTVTDTAGQPLQGICAQAATAAFVGGLAQTGDDGNYTITLTQPGEYRVQFVDCTPTPVYAGQWWPQQPPTAPDVATAVTVALGQVITGIDAALTSGATGTISGTVLNLNGVAMAQACVIAYLPTQYALTAAVNQDGTYTLTGVPSGTYALAFLGCEDGNPSGTVPDPEAATTRYNAAWWDDVPLSLQGTSNGGPDPIAQGAQLVTVSPGQDLTGYDRCFGCTAITILSITPGTGALTVEFATPGLAPPAATALAYTATCTSANEGATGSATGPASAVTVTGLTNGAAYSCQVTATDGATTVASSALAGPLVLPASRAPIPLPDTPTAAPGTVSENRLTPSTTPASHTPDANPPDVLPRTGSSTATALPPIGIALLALGLILAVATRPRRYTK
jgi:LPXTG-motif cell wall-anchored protein